MVASQTPPFMTPAPPGQTSTPLPLGNHHFECLVGWYFRPLILNNRSRTVCFAGDAGVPGGDAGRHRDAPAPGGAQSPAV